MIPTPTISDLRSLGERNSPARTTRRTWPLELIARYATATTMPGGSGADPQPD
jgi:hypothetical protein